MKSATIASLHKHCPIFFVACAAMILAMPAFGQNDDLAFANFSEVGQANHSCLNNGSGLFTCTPVSGDTESTHGVVAVDIDADGDDDLVFARSKTFSSPLSNNQLCINDGMGVFSCSNISDDQLDSRGVTFGDFDNDGDIDLVFANNDGQSADPTDRICVNDGSLGFTCADISDDDINTNDVSALDWDDDGDLDLVFAAQGNNRLCENDGSGTFSCSVFGTSIFESTSTLPVDIDDDGDLDVILTNWLGVDEICFNDEGSTSCDTVPGNTGDTYASAVADFDSDGNLDIAFANPISNDTSRKNRLCLNDGNETFTCSDISENTDHSRDIVAADLDGDGDMDLAIANERFFTFGPGAGYNRICLNDGLAVFTCEDIDTTQLNSTSVVVGNFDGTPVSVDDVIPISSEFTIRLEGANPVRYETAVVLSVDTSQQVEIDVVDILGRQVDHLYKGVANPNNEKRLTWDASSVAPGAYFVRAAGERGVAVKSFVVVR